MKFINDIVFQPPGVQDSTYKYLLMLRNQDVMEYVLKEKSPNKIYYLHCKAPTLSTKPYKDFVILYNHGNAEDLGCACHLLRCMAKTLEVSVLGYDYSGYGFSGFPSSEVKTSPTEKEVYSDADCIYTHVTTKLGYHPKKVILMGRSVGGGPTCYLAQKHHTEVAGVILQSTFTSCFNVVSNCLPHCLPCMDLFPNYKRVKKVLGCPVLLMHGDADTVVPFECSQKLMTIFEKSRRRAYEKAEKKIKKMSKSSSPNGSSHGSSAPPAREGEAVNLFYPLRDYTKSTTAQTDLERLGIFYKWFEGSDHNNMNRKSSPFSQKRSFDFSDFAMSLINAHSL
ncbi:serine peptidase [Angomonas deanei]|uniref:Serine aminopeptidase, S33/alpha/beta hydrolase fold, putative n=1 Tax=Angomonas deanei TaxID=59799 RepID=A0A7G2CDB3_9TRYP|nr:serine peptidase [Angomonas deanei]CAD2217828.1 Serine aminopeptidase, S33/alpha/beta hydrolase fold, putative [Angomonas deanei]|eukprot:EPY34574.1 serine peptidase [Angomonas deanei]